MFKTSQASYVGRSPTTPTKYFMFHPILQFCEHIPSIERCSVCAPRAVAMSAVAARFNVEGLNHSGRRPRQN